MKDIDYNLKKLLSLLEPLGGDFEKRGRLLAERGWLAATPIYQEAASFGASKKAMDEERLCDIESCKMFMSGFNYKSSLLRELRLEAEKRYALTKNYIDEGLTGYIRNLMLIQQDNKKYWNIKSSVESKIENLRNNEISSHQFEFASNESDSKSLEKLVIKILASKLGAKGFAQSKTAERRGPILFVKPLMQNCSLVFGVFRQGLYIKNDRSILGALDSGWGLASVTGSVSKIDDHQYVIIPMDATFPLRRQPFLNPYLRFRDARELEVIMFAQLAMFGIISDQLKDFFLEVR